MTGVPNKINWNDARFLQLLSSTSNGLRFRDFQKLKFNDKTIREILNRLREAGYIEKSEGKGHPTYRMTGSGQAIFFEEGKQLLDEEEIQQEARLLVDKLGVEKALKRIKLISKELEKRELERRITSQSLVGSKEYTLELQQMKDEIDRREKLWDEYYETDKKGKEDLPKYKKLFDTSMKDFAKAEGPGSFALNVGRGFRLSATCLMNLQTNWRSNVLVKSVRVMWALKSH